MRIQLSFASLVALVLAACGSNTDPVIIIASDDGGLDTLSSDAGDGSSDSASDTPSDVAFDTAADTPLPSDGSPPKCTTSPSTGKAPSARSDASGVLAPDQKSLLVFGGDTSAATCGDVATHTHAGDTWILDVGCGAWRQVPDGATTPGARARHAMVSDVDAGRALLFGGRTRTGSTGDYRLFNDLWAFEFKTESWSQLTTSGTTPSPRGGTSMVLSKKRNKLYVFGGSTSTTDAFTAKNDTYSLDLKTGVWTAIAASASPLPGSRLAHASAIDDDAAVVYVYGGGDASALTGPYFPDLWALDLGTEKWTRIDATGLPPARIDAGMVWDSVGHRLVVFGGHDDGTLGSENDVWTLDPKATAPAWSNVGLGDVFSKASTGTCKFPADFTTIDKASPERRSAFVFGARTDGHGFVVHGGKGDCGVLADAWWFDVGASTWTTMVKSPIGLSCLRYSTTCSGLCG